MDTIQDSVGGGTQGHAGPRVSVLQGSPYLVKVGDDLVQKAQTLHTHVVAIQLDVEVIEVGDGCKHDPHLRVRLVVEVLGRGESKVGSGSEWAARAAFRAGTGGLCL